MPQDTSASVVGPRAFSIAGIDLNRTLRSFSFFGRDPTTTFVRERRGEVGALTRATLTPQGPATALIRWQGPRASVCAWGPGAEWVDAHAEGWCGVLDDPAAFTPDDPVIAKLHRRFAGVRMAQTRTGWHDILRIIIQQLIRTRDAADQWRRMVRAWGTPAPGPLDVMLPPDPKIVAAAPYFDFHPFGIEKKRADTMRRVAKHADVVERAVMLPPIDARTALERIAGVGPWTSTSWSEGCQGDPDALILGDYHLAKYVVYALTGDEDGTDDEMVELLAPFAGQRARVVKLLTAGAKKPPRRSNRIAQNDIRGA